MKKTYFLILGGVLVMAVLLTACGHKGPPQPPEEMVSAPGSQKVL